MIGPGSDKKLCPRKQYISKRGFPMLWQEAAPTKVQQIRLQLICLHLFPWATKSMTEKFLPYLYSSAFRTFTSKPKFRLQSRSCKVKQNRQRSTWPSIHSLHHYKVKQNKKSLQLIFAVLFKRIGSTSSVLCQNACIAPRGLCHPMPERMAIYPRFHYLQEDFALYELTNEMYHYIG